MAKDKLKTIYVLVRREDAWDVIRWSEHPALAPHSGGIQKVSTAAGDVELRLPPLAERNYELLGWAQQRIEQIHPRPDYLALEHMSVAALLRETLQLSLEYIALAEDGSGHSARSAYLARQVREIQQFIAQRLAGTSICIKEKNDG